MAASDAKPFPIKGQAYRITLPILDADGDPVSGAANLDSEVSKDSGAFADCANEAVEIATSSGIYYLDLTATEMNASTVCILVKSTTAGAKTTPIVLYPVDLSVAQLGVNTVQAGGTAWGSGAITPASIATNAIDADALAADAVAEIQSGLATAAALAVVSAYVDELESRLTAARAGYLDNLSGGAVALAATLATVSGYVDELESRLTALRAGHLDNLSGGPVALASALATLTGYVDTEVAAILAAVDTEVAAIKAKTDALPASPAAVGSAMTLAANAVNASAVAADAVAEIQAGLATAAAVAALNNLSAGQVNAEVVDALSVDAYGEPGSVPAATASVVAMIHFLYTWARNKHLTTATQDRVRNDGDTADIGAAGISDDGTTFTRGEYA